MEKEDKSQDQAFYLLAIVNAPPSGKFPCGSLAD